MRLPIIGQLNVIVPLKAPNRCSLENKCIGVGFRDFLLGGFPMLKKRLPATLTACCCAGILYSSAHN
jgi:hypothetical protein